MQMIEVGKDEARTLFTETKLDRGYWRAVTGSRWLSHVFSTVDTPERIVVPTDRPLMIAANHSSLYDLIAALIVLGNYGITTRIGVNSRFFANPVAGRIFRGIGCIPFSRDDRETAEKTMVEALERGQAAALMPEGRITRLEDQVDGVGPARPGISRIALRAGAAVLPIGLARSDEAWQPGTRLPKVRLGRHTVVARFGEPIVFDTDDHQANSDRLMKRISELVLEGRLSE